jgi:hypothetical protein
MPELLNSPLLMSVNILSNLRPGELATVVSIHTDEALRQRP